MLSKFVPSGNESAVEYLIILNVTYSISLFFPSWPFRLFLIFCWTNNSAVIPSVLHHIFPAYWIVPTSKQTCYNFSLLKKNGNKEHLGGSVG